MWLRSNLGKAGVFNVSDIEKDVLYYTDEFFNFFFLFLPSKINKHNIQKKIYKCKGLPNKLNTRTNLDGIKTKECTCSCRQYVGWRL